MIPAGSCSPISGLLIFRGLNKKSDDACMPYVVALALLSSGCNSPPNSDPRSPATSPSSSPATSPPTSPR